MSSYNIVIAEAAQRDLLDLFDYVAFFVFYLKNETGSICYPPVSL